MTASEFITGPSLIILGMAVVVLVFIVRRMLLRIQRATVRSSSGADHDDFEAAEKGAVRATEMLEVRLHEFAREVEGRMLTRIAVLDRLIVDAEREIVRLREVLAETNRNAPRGSLASPGTGAPTMNSSDAGALRQPDAAVDRTDRDDRRDAA